MLVRVKERLLEEGVRGSSAQYSQYFFIGLMKFSNLLIVNWWVFVKCEPKSSQLKETKTYTSSVCVHLIYFIHKFHNLS